MREEWRKLVAEERSEEFYKPNKWSVVCSDHFSESDKYYTGKGFKRLRKTAIPRIEFDDVPGPSQPKLSCLDHAESRILPHECVVTELKQPLPTQIMDDDASVHTLTSLSSGWESVFASPETCHLKKELSKCHKKLQYKNRQVKNLKKQNKRLLKTNSSLKKNIQDLKNRRFDDSSLKI